MKRVAPLDGVRGIAILLVIVWHYWVGQILTRPYSFLSYATRAVKLTWSGVDLFFVLSGFLIAGILLDHRASANYFRVFYLRRVCRIFPLYFLVLGLFIVITSTPLGALPAFRWLFHDPLPLWSYATFTQNIFMGINEDYGPHWLGITWSIAVEEQFYFFVPLLIYLLPRRALVPFLVAAVVAAPVLRFWWPGVGAYVNMPWRSDSLLSGALLAVLVRWEPFVPWVRKQRRLVLGVFLVGLGGAGVLTVHDNALGGVYNHIWLAGLYLTFVLMAFVGTEPLLGRVLGSRVLVWFGNRSYGIYMFHQAVSGLMHGAIRHKAPQLRTLSDAWVTLASLVVTLVIAELSYRFLEGPLLRLGHRVHYLAKPPRDGAGQPVPAPVEP